MFFMTHITVSCHFGVERQNATCDDDLGEICSTHWTVLSVFVVVVVVVVVVVAAADDDDATGRESMAQGVVKQPTVSFSSMVTGTKSTSDPKTESLVMHSRVDPRKNSSSSWQAVVITTSSVAVLLLVAFLAVCHLRQSTTAARFRNSMLQNKPFIVLISTTLASY